MAQNKILFKLGNNVQVYFNLHAAGPHRLMTIDESASILSDISYDKTDDSLVSTAPVKS